MKKIFLFALLASFSTTRSEAQSLKFGIKAGLNIANMTISDAGDVDDNRAITSFHAGGYLDLPLAPVFSIQPGLFITGKGSKYTVGDKSGSNWYEIKSNPIYLELPVNAVGKIPLAGDMVKLIVGAGPYVAMGIAGKNSVEGEFLGADFSDDENIEFSNDEPGNGNNGTNGNLKRFDFGLNFLGGVEIGRLTLNAQYGLGLVNIKPGSENSDGDNYKNRVLSLSVGLLF